MDLPSQHEDPLENLIVSILQATGDTTWDTAQQGLRNINPSLASPLMLLRARKIYDTSTKVAALHHLSQEELACISQDANSRQNQAAYLAAAPREELDRIVAQTIQLCTKRCSVQIVKQQIALEWPDLSRPEYKHVWTTLDQILADPATVRHILDHADKINSQTA